MLALTMLCAVRLMSAATEQEHANAECSDVPLSSTIYAEAHPAWYPLPGKPTVPDSRYGQALYALGALWAAPRIWLTGPLSDLPRWRRHHRRDYNVDGEV